VQCNIPSIEAQQNRAPLADGTIRKLLASEHEKVRDHLLRLSPADRRLRFLGYVGDDFIVAHSEKVFAAGGIILGCFVRGMLCAVGELHHDGTYQVAEVAITVEQSVQNCGIGTELLRRLVEIARNRAIKTLHCFCLLDNKRAQKIARKLGGVLQWVDGAVKADIIQPWPNYWSLLGEVLADGQAVLHAWWGEPVERSLAPRADAAR
jgi:GNAT superfamily N-acetyltransferase